MSRRANPDERERKRLHILEVAAGEFARRGFDGANINTISERAGFGKGTVYLYAASKEELFLDVLREIGTQTRNALEERLTETHDLSMPVRLRALAEAFTELAREHPDFVHLQTSALFGVNRRFQDEAAAVWRAISAEIARYFDAEQQRGEMRPVAADGLAVLLLGTLQTFSMLPDVLGYGTAEMEARIDLLVDIFWRGLAPSSEYAPREYVAATSE